MLLTRRAVLGGGVALHQTSAEDAGRIAAEAGVKMLVLSHLVPAEDPLLTEPMWLEAARRYSAAPSVWVTICSRSRRPGSVMPGVRPVVVMAIVARAAVALAVVLVAGHYDPLLVKGTSSGFRQILASSR